VTHVTRARRKFKTGQLKAYQLSAAPSIANSRRNRGEDGDQRIVQAHLIDEKECRDEISGDNAGPVLKPSS